MNCARAARQEQGITAASMITAVTATYRIRSLACLRLLLRTSLGVETIASVLVSTLVYSTLTNAGAEMILGRTVARATLVASPGTLLPVTVE